MQRMSKKGDVEVTHQKATVMCEKSTGLTHYVSEEALFRGRWTPQS